jgi:hypothetical protein
MQLFCLNIGRNRKRVYAVLNVACSFVLFKLSLLYAYIYSFNTQQHMAAINLEIFLSSTGVPPFELICVLAVHTDFIRNSQLFH